MFMVTCADDQGSGRQLGAIRLYERTARMMIVLRGPVRATSKRRQMWDRRVKGSLDVREIVVTQTGYIPLCRAVVEAGPGRLWREIRTIR